MAKNFKQKGDSIRVVAPAGGVSSGDGVLIGAALFGVASHDAAAGEDLELATEGVFELVVNPADDIAAGDRLFWNAGASLLTKTAAGNMPVAVAAKASGVGIATCEVKLVHSAPAGA